MKAASIICCLLGIVLLVNAHPKAAKPAEEEVEIVPVNDPRNFDAYDPLLNRWYQEWQASLASLWAPIVHFFNRQASENGTDILEPEFGFPIAPFDLKGANSTSVTQVIDGHKVVINETEFKKDDDDDKVYFKVRIVDVKPHNPEAGSPSPNNNSNKKPTVVVDVDTTSTNNNKESMEEVHIDNEIPKSGHNANEERIRRAEHFDATPNSNRHFLQEFFPYRDLYIEPLEYSNEIKRQYYLDEPEASPETGDIQNFVYYNDNNNDFNHQRHIVDLSRDIYVNELAKKADKPLNPDAEYIDFVPVDNDSAEDLRDDTSRTNIFY